MHFAIPVLSLTIWLPIIGGLAVLASGDKAPNISRWVALSFSVLAFLVSLLLWTGFDASTAQMQFVERAPWIPSFNAWYHLGVDGISMPLIILTTFITILVLISGWEVISYKPSQYMAAFLIMEGVMVGVFSALDAILFYVFWEAMLIPMFIIIGVWGGPKRVYATIKFFLYTFFGSVFMLVALIYMYFKSGSYSILDFQALPLSLTEQIWIFLAFLAAFAVKVPMWPVHTWLPDAHVEAPTGGSVILAAIMLKIGGYGFLRFSLPITPDASATLDWLVIAMSLIAVVYIGFVALVQQDMKKLIAYSSIAHMGFVTLGFFIAFSIFARAGRHGWRGDGHGGWHGADGLPWLRFGGHVPLRRGSLRSSPLPRDLDLRGRDSYHARVWRPDGLLRHGQCRPARAPRDSWASSWSFWPASRRISGMPSWRRPP